jgi:MFS family permease
MFTAYAVAGIVGPMIGGSIFKAYHAYTVAFYTAGVLAVVALFAIYFTRKPDAEPASSSPVFSPAKGVA